MRNTHGWTAPLYWQPDGAAFTLPAGGFSLAPGGQIQLELRIVDVNSRRFAVDV